MNVQNTVGRQPGTNAFQKKINDVTHERTSLFDISADYLIDFHTGSWQDGEWD